VKNSCEKCGAALEQTQCSYCRWINPSFDANSAEVQMVTTKAQNEMGVLGEEKRARLKRAETELSEELEGMRKLSKKSYMRIAIGLFFAWGFFSTVFRDFGFSLIFFVLAALLIAPSSIKLYNEFRRSKLIKEKLKSVEEEYFNLIK